MRVHSNSTPSPFLLRGMATSSTSSRVGGSLARSLRFYYSNFIDAHPDISHSVLNLSIRTPSYSSAATVKTFIYTIIFYIFLYCRRRPYIRGHFGEKLFWKFPFEKFRRSYDICYSCRNRGDFWEDCAINLSQSLKP